MKTSLLLALVTLTSASVSLAQFGGPDPSVDLPPLPPDLPPANNLSPYAVAEAVQQPNGCFLFVGEADDPEGQPMTFEWTAQEAGSPDEIFLGNELTVTACLPPGYYSVVFKVTDSEGLYTRFFLSVLVETRRSAPDLKVKSVAPSVLWPPNGKLWPIQLAYEVTHDADAKPEVRIVSVHCNQEINSTDFVQTGPMELYLAARRTSRLGERIYEVTIEAVDADGLKDTEKVSIHVPADQDSGGSPMAIMTRPAKASSR